MRALGFIVKCLLKDDNKKIISIINSLIGEYVCMDLHYNNPEWCEAIERFATPPNLIKTSQGCRNLVPAPSPATSGETSVRDPWAVAKRADSYGIFWLITLPNLGQGPIS